MVDGEGLEGKGQGEFLELEEEVDELKAEAMPGLRSSMMGSSEEMAVSVVSKREEAKRKKINRR